MAAGGKSPPPAAAVFLPSFAFYVVRGPRFYMTAIAPRRIIRTFILHFSSLCFSGLAPKVFG